MRLTDLVVALSKIIGLHDANLIGCWHLATDLIFWHSVHWQAIKILTANLVLCNHVLNVWQEVILIGCNAGQAIWRHQLSIDICKSIGALDHVHSLYLLLLLLHIIHLKIGKIRQWLLPVSIRNHGHIILIIVLICLGNLIVFHFILVLDLILIIRIRWRNICILILILNLIDLFRLSSITGKAIILIIYLLGCSRN